jgi:hypothetical protein
MMNNIAVILLAAGALCCGHSASATTFYIDSSHGNDANTGISEDQAWATLDKVNAHRFIAGDRLLFRAGQRWTGRFAPKGSGTTETPMLATSYGDGAKPLIAGAGADEAIYIDDISHWTLQGLAVTNHGSSTGPYRNGIKIHVAYVPVVQGIHLVDMDVTDVNGDVHSKSAGGIGIEGWDKNGKAVHFDDVLIQRCHVSHVDGQGLWLHMKGSANDDSSEDASTNGGRGYPDTHVRITGTTFEDIGRNAIFLRDTLGALIDHNTVLHAAARTHGNAVVIAWAKDTVVRDNEVAFTGVDQGGGENGGFDADDGAVDTLFEYNWTHDNSGGSVNVVADPRYNASPNYGTVVRFNVSENDGARVFAVGGTVSNTSFVNNTAYVPKGKTEKIVSFGRFTPKKPGDPDHIVVVNNLFLVDGSAQYEIEASQVMFGSNCYVGKHAGGPKEPRKVTTDASSVGLGQRSPGSAGWASLDMYRPVPGGTCSGNGAVLPDVGTRDARGNAVRAGLYDRGALAARQP